MNVAVVGGTGVLGAPLVAELAARGDDVLVLSRKPPRELPAGASHRSVDLTDGKVVNRQDVKVNTDPPKTIAAGDSGEFKTEQGDSGKNQHLKVQYTVGSGGSETVAFGYKVDGLDASCFTDTPSDISGSHNDCDYDDTSFEFSPK